MRWRRKSVTTPGAAVPNTPSGGPSIDARGHAVRDPSTNVLDLVDAAIQRQDDLRKSEFHRLDDLREKESEHFRELANLRSSFAQELRALEKARIDAIRAVDVTNVQRAAEVSATQAATLAAQVTASAETLRAQVAAADKAATTALAAALEPIQKDIADLRRVQYEQAGQRAQVVETRDIRGEGRLNLGAIFGGLSVLLVLIFGVITVVISLQMP